MCTVIVSQFFFFHGWLFSLEEQQQQLYRFDRRGMQPMVGLVLFGIVSASQTMIVSIYGLYTWSVRAFLFENWAFVRSRKSFLLTII